ncbi:hypothetical protein SLS62_009537 [Diatrype stigma]|uniref:Uncharacterized protein n=1 Tax=Diatrype stigma TaxID=117547 RepID=A0AAN9UE63_9PEZI
MATAAQRLPRPRKLAGNTNSPPPKGNYAKLIRRFYESLTLLNILGQARGLRDVNPGRAYTSEERRRRLLRNLSYLCDYNKGGDTTTAIALEEQCDRFSFWVASNSNDANSMTEFLQRTLAEIKIIIHLPSDQRVLSESAFTQTCIRFAQLRVRKEIKWLTKEIRNCERYLDLNPNSDDVALRSWLRQFLEGDYLDVCLLAYNQRKAPEMKYMKTRIVKAHELQTSSQMPARFDLVRHFIGRLAHHVRAPQQVVEDLSHLDRFLTAYDVRHIPRGDDIAPPNAGAPTHLYEILGRMFPRGSARLREYEENLPMINHRLSLQQQFDEQHSSIKPVVHAEIRVLEYFYEKRLEFADQDRFIGPDGHYKVWLNWGPPALQGGTRDPRYIHQRDILNKMNITIRLEALEQLDRKAGPLNIHPDSHTGITPTEASGHSNVARLASAETEFAALRIADGFSSPPSEAPSEGGDEIAGSDDESDAEGGGAALG